MYCFEEVNASDKIRTKLQENAKPVMVFSKNLPENEIDVMHFHYKKQNSGNFNRLIEIAKILASMDSILKQLSEAHSKSASNKNCLGYFCQFKHLNYRS